MKLVDRVKSIDWKQFGINHGEKIGLGVVGLLVVLILFSGTRWKTFQEKQPEELTKSVDEQTKALEAATWPISEQETYSDKYDVNFVYDNTYSVVDAAKFKYPPGHPMVWSLHRRQEKIKEPTWLPVRELIATADRFVLELPPEGQEAMTDGALALTDEPSGPSEAKSREEALLKSFNQGANRSADGQNPMGKGFPGADDEGGPMAGDDAYSQYVDGDMGDMGDMGGMGDLYGMGDGTTTAAMNIRGVRYIAVRGIFPLREQFEKISQARSDPTLQNPYSVIDIRNFDIQRRSPGDKDWTTLDKQVAYDLLEEAANYADDVVDYSNTHWVITSPLPTRLVRSWSPYFVGHPKIKTLTEKEIEYRRLLNEEMVRLEKESKLQDDNQFGGFARTQRNMQALGDQIGQNDTMMKRLYSNIEQSMDMGDEGTFTMPSEMQSMLAKNQTPDYLLFRYLDFDVEPGKTYEYRVQLKIANPNRNELAEHLVSPDVAKGEVRVTPWSEPSELTAMSVDSEYFVRDITPPKPRDEPAARIDVFHWLSEVGTTANKVVEVKVGQLIGQTAPPVDKDKDDANDSIPDRLKVEVLRPYQSFELEPMDMVGQDALVDFEAPAKTSTRFHEDLGVKALKPVSEILVVNQYGQLASRNPLTQRNSYQRADRLRHAEHDPWEYLKQAGDEGLDADGGMDPDMGLDGMGDVSDLILRSSPGGMKGKAGAGGRGGGDAAGGRGGGGRSGATKGGANPLRRNRRFGGGMDS